MTKRYFYRCPIAAAWQLKSHNILCQVNFTHYDGDYYLPCDEEALLDIMKRGNHKFYISQDSVPLLQPMVGDMVTNIGMVAQRVESIGSIYLQHASGQYTLKIDAKIIMRNNLAWISPEVEE